MIVDCFIYSNYIENIQGVPGLKVHINIFELKKKME